METPLYNASKFAITGFVRSLAGLEELGIRVTAIAPALVQVRLLILFLRILWFGFVCFVFLF